jgi:hypothetical protein
LSKFVERVYEDDRLLVAPSVSTHPLWKQVRRAATAVLTTWGLGDTKEPLVADWFDYVPGPSDRPQGV